MPTFEHPPAWWISLANLTQWLYWPAWSAIFSFLALMWAISLANRNSRDTRAKEVVLLRTASAHINVIIQHFVRLLERIEGLDDSKTRRFTASSRRVLDQAAVLETFHALDASGMPTPGTAGALLASGVTTRHLVVLLDRFNDNPNAVFNRGRIETNLDRLRKHKERLDQEAKRRGYRPSRSRKTRFHGFTKSLKSLPAWARTTWTALFKPKA